MHTLKIFYYFGFTLLTNFQLFQSTIYISKFSLYIKLYNNQNA